MKRRRSVRAMFGLRGTAMVEFAVAAPVLVVMMCGVGDVAIVVFARMLTSNAAQGMVDLVTQSAMLQPTDMGNIFNAAYAMMQPLSTANLSLRVTSIYSDGNGNAYVYWSCGYGSLQPQTPKTAVSTINNDPVTNFISLTKSAGPPPADSTNSTIVVVESLNTITAPTQYVLKGTQNINPMAFSLPRLSTYVGFPWNGSKTTTPPLPTATTTTDTVSVSTSKTTVTCNYAK